METTITNREREILSLMSKGYSSKLIACELNLSLHTVNTHRKNIYRKLNLSTAIMVVMQAQTSGLLAQAEPMLHPSLV